MSIFLCPKTGLEWSDSVHYNNLLKWGLSQDILDQYQVMAAEGNQLGRVTEVQKGRLRVATDTAVFWCNVSGRYRYANLEMPAVGDWVTVYAPLNEESGSIITGLLPRKTKFSRKIAGTTSEEQIIAANVDHIFICMALNGDFNIRRLERYMSVAWDSGAMPTIILTKADLCADPVDYTSQVSDLFIGVAIHTICGFNDSDIQAIKALIAPGKTVVFTGSSGVGKSTLINGLIGEVAQATQSVGDGDKGRHTTTSRKLLQLDNGGILVDTPGMREFGLLGDEEEGIAKSFEDIHALAAQCHYGNCTHGNEKGCRIREALEEGTLDSERYESFLKLQRESEYMARKQDAHSQKKYLRHVAKQNRSSRKIKY